MTAELRNRVADFHLLYTSVLAAPLKYDKSRQNYLKHVGNILLCLSIVSYKGEENPSFIKERGTLGAGASFICLRF